MNKLILYGVGIPVLAAGCASTSQNFSTANDLEARMRGAPQISLEVDLNNPERTCEEFDAMPEFLGTDTNETVLDINYSVDVEVSCIDGTLRKLEVKDQETGETVRVENYDSDFKLHGLSGTYRKSDGAPVSEKIHGNGTLFSEKTWYDNAQLATEKIFNKNTGKIELEREFNEKGVETLITKYNLAGSEIYKLIRHNNGKKATEERWNDNHKLDGDSFAWDKHENKLSHYQHRGGIEVGTQTEWYAGTDTKKEQRVLNEQGELEYLKSWHSDSSLKEDKPYNNGVPTETHWDYFIGGKANPKHKNPFDAQGRQHGEETIWKSGKEPLDQRVIFNVYRHEGEEMGLMISVDEEGVTTKTNYVNGVQKGPAEVIETDGTLRP